MKLKVKTVVDLSEEQRHVLQRLGCDASPFISWAYTLVFAATCTREQEHNLRSLDYVTEVAPMPVYGPA